MSRYLVEGALWLGIAMMAWCLGGVVLSEVRLWFWRRRERADAAKTKAPPDARLAVPVEGEARAERVWNFEPGPSGTVIVTLITRLLLGDGRCRHMTTTLHLNGKQAALLDAHRSDLVEYAIREGARVPGLKTMSNVEPASPDGPSE